MEYSLGNSENPSMVGSAIKLPVFIVAGATASFLLFALMSELIKSENPDISDTKPSIPVVVYATPEDKKVIERDRKLPEPPKPATPPKRAPQPTAENSDPLIAFNPGTGVQVPGPVLNKLSFEGPRDNGAVAIVRVQPQYPAKAARNGIEGWVSLSFSIDPTGRVTNIKVVDSHPNRIFDQAAKRAMKKWKYKPQIKDGKAITVDGQTIVLDFTLDQREA